MKKIYVLLIILLLWNSALSYQMVANRNEIIENKILSNKNDEAFLRLQYTASKWLEVLINKTRHLKYVPNKKSLNWL